MKIKAIIILFLELSVFLNIAAQENNDKRSTIVESNGYAYLSEDKTIRELRQEALDNAKRNALERAQTYIKSITKVENFVLSYDLIQSGAEGFVRIIDDKDIGITDDNRYQYWIKAEVSYTLLVPEDVNIKNNNLPLTVTLKTDRQIYKNSDKIILYVQGNKDFYGTIIYKNANGELIQIFPNQHDSNNFFKGNQLYAIPRVNDKFEFEVMPPFGQEEITIYSSVSELGKPNISPFGKNFYKINGNIDELDRNTRSVKIIKSKDQTLESDFFEASYMIMTKEK